MAIFETKDGAYPLAAFGDRLCRFDASHAECFAAGRLKADAPSAAAVLGEAYFYADATFGQGGALYAVTDVGNDAAVFGETGFSVGDVGAAVEDVAATGSYLVGLAGNQVVVVRIENGAPSTHALVAVRAVTKLRGAFKMQFLLCAA